MRYILPWLGLLPLLALATAATGCDSGDAATADPWAAGYALNGWDRIGALQRYPMLDPAPPDWNTLCRDTNPLVRTAAAMAIARAADPTLVPVLRPMLKDENPLVRCWALRALLRVRSPRIREPLLEALAAWENFETADGQGFDFARVGLPLDMANRPQRERRQWVEQYGPDWSMDTGEPVLDWSMQRETTVCVKASEIDAGEPVALRFQVHAKGAEERLSLGLAGMFVQWQRIDADGRPTTNRPYTLRHQFPHDMGEPKRERIDLEPGPNGPFDLTLLTCHTPPPPGIYLCRTLHGAMLLIRVRRSAAMERRIPNLLKPPIDAATAKTLGTQRVRAAVGPLIEAYRATAGSGPLALAAAEALGRIGDPRGAGVLLDHPHLRESGGTCVTCGSTAGALEMLGEAAWPACEQHLRSWRGRLAGDKALGLVLALRVLGPHGSAEAVRARQEIIRDLSTALGREREPRRDDPRPLVLAAAVRAAASEQPDLVVKAVNRLAARPRLAARLLLEVDNGPCPDDIAERIARGVWRLAQSRPADDPLRTRLADIAGRMAPSIFTEMGVITGEEEALAAIQAVRAVKRTLPPETLGRLRKETCDRAEAWLEATSKPPERGTHFRLSLARLQIDAEQYEACLRLLDVPADAFERPSQKIDAAAFRGLALMGLRRFDEAEAALKWAVDQLEHESGAGYIHESDIRRRYWEVWWMPRCEDLRVCRVFLRGGAKQAGGRVFNVDPAFRLKAADPLTGSETTWTTLPQAPRDFAPLDARRVFVALKDGTAALYEEGKARPVWRRPLPLATESYVSAGRGVITAAAEDGTLHALDPTTGRTRWTRRVQVSAWTAERGSPGRTLLRQAEDVVLVPDREEPNRLECVDAPTGKHLWTVRGTERLSEVAVGGDLVVLGGPPGHVRAFHRRTGRPVFEVDLCPELKTKRSPVALALDPKGRCVYASVRRHVWALDAASGRVLWHWTWQPAKALVPPKPSHFPTPRLYAVEDGVFALLNWWEPGRDWPPDDHVDVVRFSADGDVRVHETSPYLRHHLDALVTPRRLAIDGGTSWELWEFLPPAL